MASYRYLVTDLLTTTIIAELPLTNVTWGQALNEAGQFSGEMLLSDSRIVSYLGTGATNPIEACTVPGKTGLYVERNGQLIWGGIIWSREYDSGSQKLRLGGKEFDSYFGKRCITSDEVFDEGTDQFTVVKRLVDVVQSVPRGNIGINTSLVGTCGQGLADILPILEYEHRNLLDVIVDLSKQGPPFGFDFHVDVAYDIFGNPTQNLRLFYPHKSSNYDPESATYPMLEFPGTALSYAFPEDGSSIANIVYAFGPGTNEGQYISIAYGNNDGFPVLEDVITYSQIPDPRIVDRLAQSEARVRVVPVTTMSMVWSPQPTSMSSSVDASFLAPVHASGPNFDEFTIGDQFRIRITDARFPSGVELSRRLANFDVQVGDDGAELIQGRFVVVSY